MKTWAGRSVNDGKASRRLELVSNLRSNAVKSQRRFRIGLADNLFAESRLAPLKPNNAPALQSAPQAPRNEESIRPEFAKTDFAIGLAAIAGLTIGYLIGKYRK